MRYIVSYSGGMASFATACRLVDQHGRDAVTLVFADTLIEDEDLYRFLREGAIKLGCELVWLKDGRNPWEVFEDKRYIGNTRTAHCSSELKTKQVRQWLKANCDPATTTLCLGISWDEKERLERAQANWQGWTVTAPLCESPMWTQEQVERCLTRYDIRKPRLYTLGFAHNNCGGFCVRAGQGQFKALLEAFPDRYKWHEDQMESLMGRLPTARSFLRQTDIKGDLQYITLKDWREHLEANPQLELIASGGCGCFVDDGEEAA